ncbi:MAG: hypothetical protein R3325_03895 [Thermoanaerobaculia bacterium]|nr:hypothetical protein [Thermoanaerobaculia bacterium]
MKPNGLVYFAFGWTTLISLGAAFNQVVAPPSTLSLGDTGIVFPDGTVQTTAAKSDSRRAFYLTSSGHSGSLALGACAPGFHMASLWEIFDVSTLRYATDSEGAGDVFRADDSGQGPPTDRIGFVRTGGGSFDVFQAKGLSNCAAWTSSSPMHVGTGVELEPRWDSPTGAGEPSVVIAPWDAGVLQCSQDWQVWCVAD